MAKSQKLIWVKPSFSKELDGFKLVVEEHTPTHDPSNYRFTAVARSRLITTNLNLLKASYTRASTQTLDDSIWRKLDNSTSWSAINAGKGEDALAKAGESSVHLSDIITEFNTGRIRTPIILQHDREYSLITGNTRLIVCRVGNIIPKVVFVKSFW